MNLSFGVPALAGPDRLKVEHQARCPVGSLPQLTSEYWRRFALHEPYPSPIPLPQWGDRAAMTASRRRGTQLLGERVWGGFIPSAGRGR